MNLNPLALLEKAIIEHGSAAILKERLELVREECGSLQRKLDDSTIAANNLGLTIAQLQAENHQLRLQCDEYKAEIDKLQKRLSQTHDELDEVEESILTYLSKHDSCEEEEIQQMLRVGPQRIKVHLEKLELAELVRNFSGYLNDCWTLTAKGRRKLFDEGKLA